MNLPPITFTILKAVYKAGMRRGEDEACAYEHGTRASGDEYDNLVEALHEAVNEDREWGSESYQDWNAVETWVKAQLNP